MAMLRLPTARGEIRWAWAAGGGPEDAERGLPFPEPHCRAATPGERLGPPGTCQAGCHLRLAAGNRPHGQAPALAPQQVSSKPHWRSVLVTPHTWVSRSDSKATRPEPGGPLTDSLASCRPPPALILSQFHGTHAPHAERRRLGSRSCTNASNSCLRLGAFLKQISQLLQLYSFIYLRSSVSRGPGSEQEAISGPLSLPPQEGVTEALPAQGRGARLLYTKPGAQGGEGVGGRSHSTFA